MDETRRDSRQPPPDRGRLLSPEEVSEEILRGHRSPQWVRRNVPYKIRLGHSSVAWWEADVLDWLDSRRED